MPINLNKKQNETITPMGGSISFYLDKDSSQNLSTDFYDIAFYEEESDETLRASQITVTISRPSVVAGDDVQEVLTNTSTFLNQQKELNDTYNLHVANKIIHITDTERIKWNNSLAYIRSYTIPYGAWTVANENLFKVAIQDSIIVNDNIIGDVLCTPEALFFLQENSAMGLYCYTEKNYATIFLQSTNTPETDLEISIRFSGIEGS